MKAANGMPYVWGGNVRQGVFELLSFYYQGISHGKDKKRLALAGLDCSGLLYEATNGWTPRNTSALIRFGDGVPVAGISLLQITALLEPLDLIVWNGHVLIVLDKQTIIESRLECGKTGNGGVIISSLQQRLGSIMKTRQPTNEWPTGGKKKDQFVVRRWYPI
jgi:cell wall-associated NlpC family hydrolase